MALSERGLTRLRIQPEGLPDSSRWSQRSADHRKAKEKIRTLKECQKNRGTPPGCGQTSLLSGGLRYAATTGYFLPNPPG